MASTHESVRSFQPSEDTNGTAVSKWVTDFSKGHGPILSREDQRVALGSRNAHSDHLPSNESLLDQLRVDARKYEREAPNSLRGLESPQAYHERQLRIREIRDHETGIAMEFDKVKNYTPQQLKDIGDLADAAQDPKKLQEIMKRFTDPEKFTDLQEGLRLEMERRHSHFSLGTGFHTNEKGERIATLYVTNNKTNAFKEYDGPAQPQS